MGKVTPIQRTKALLKEQGIRCEVVEKFNPYAGPYGIKQDFMGIIDILAMDKERGVVAYQVCGTDFAPHVHKLFANAQDCIDWLSCPGTFLYIIGWRKLLKKRGGKAKVWTPRIQEFKLEDFV